MASPGGDVERTKSHIKMGGGIVAGKVRLLVLFEGQDGRKWRQNRATHFAGKGKILDPGMERRKNR